MKDIYIINNKKYTLTQEGFKREYNGNTYSFSYPKSMELINSGEAINKDDKTIESDANFDETVMKNPIKKKVPREEDSIGFKKPSIFEQIKKNWQDWKDGAEDRKRLSLIRKRAYRISRIREARIWKEEKARGIIHCGRCGYDHHREATCEEAIADNEGIPLRDVIARNPQKSTAQRAQQSFMSSIIFGVWK